MKKLLKTFGLGVFLISCFVLNANASLIDTHSHIGYDEYLWYGNDDEDVVAGILEISADEITLARVEGNDDPDNEGIGSTTDPFDLTSTGVGMTGSKYSTGIWTSEFALTAFAVKADGYAMITILDTPAISGAWDLGHMWSWWEDEDPGDWPIMTGNGSPGISHFSGYTVGASVPEPATAFSLGIGLLGLAVVGRKKIFKK